MYIKRKVRRAIFYLRGNAFVCFLLVKFMSDEERKELEGERRDLFEILDFYAVFNDDIRSMTEEQKEQHINYILDRIWQINQILGD